MPHTHINIRICMFTTYNNNNVAVASVAAVAANCIICMPKTNHFFYFVSHKIWLRNRGRRNTEYKGALSKPPSPDFSTFPLPYLSNRLALSLSLSHLTRPQTVGVKKSSILLRNQRNFFDAPSPQPEQPETGWKSNLILLWFTCAPNEASDVPCDWLPESRSPSDTLSPCHMPHAAPFALCYCYCCCGDWLSLRLSHVRRHE